MASFLKRLNTCGVGGGSKLIVILIQLSDLYTYVYTQKLTPNKTTIGRHTYIHNVTIKHTSQSAG